MTIKIIQDDFGTMYDFTSQIEYGSQLGVFTEEQIKNEPMMFSADAEFALNNSGPITTEFINNLFFGGKWEDTKLKDIIIDSRSHMFVINGSYACIPGFHTDQVIRSRSDGQPDYSNRDNCAQHCMALINGDICPTKFLLGRFVLPDVPIGKKVYKKWDKELRQKIDYPHFIDHKRVKLVEHLVESNKLIFFDWTTFHEGTPSVKTGWRFFIRATRYSDRKPTNEIRRQVQIYLPLLTEGW